MGGADIAPGSLFLELWGGMNYRNVSSYRLLLLSCFSFLVVASQCCSAVMVAVLTDCRVPHTELDCAGKEGGGRFGDPSGQGWLWRLWRVLCQASLWHRCERLEIWSTLLWLHLELQLYKYTKVQWWLYWIWMIHLTTQFALWSVPKLNINN